MTSPGARAFPDGADRCHTPATGTHQDGTRPGEMNPEAATGRKTEERSEPEADLDTADGFPFSASRVQEVEIV